MSTFKQGAIDCKNGVPRNSDTSITGVGIYRNQWQKGWDWEYFNPSGEKQAGTVDRAYNGERYGEQPSILYGKRSCDCQ